MAPPPPPLATATAAISATSAWSFDADASPTHWAPSTSPCARPPALVEKHAPLAKHRRANYDATAEEDPFLEPPPAPEPPRGIITRGAASRATAAPSWAEGYDDLAR